MASAADRMVRIDGHKETLATLDATPAQINKARARALRKLLTVAQREVARAVSRQVGMSQKTFIAMGRINSRRQPDGALEIWLGTNPIAAQYLGAVRWKRTWPGAKAGRQTFPGAWSWVDKANAKTGQAIMQRNPDGSISEVTVDIHQRVADELPRIEELLMARFERLMAQELRYAVNVEGGRQS